MQTLVNDYGTALRWWRECRRMSQLDLAGRAEVSSRHISFLETGRARPSREMVVHLADVLEVPLRDRNVLLHKSGFASMYPHNDLSAPAMNDVRDVLMSILTAHEPNPAILVNRRGDILEANTPATKLITTTVAPNSPAFAPSPNINRLTLHPDGARPNIVNWKPVATSVLQRLEREVAHRPADKSLAELLDEMLTFPDLAALRKGPDLPTGADLVVPLQIITDDNTELSLLTTIATVGAPYDVTLDEVRLETFFPMDSTTADVLHQWQSLT